MIILESVYIVNGILYTRTKKEIYHILRMTYIIFQAVTIRYLCAVFCLLFLGFR
jgi:hypothetical protein